MLEIIADLREGPCDRDPETAHDKVEVSLLRWQAGEVSWGRGRRWSDVACS